MQGPIAGFVSGYKGLPLYYAYYAQAPSRARVIFLHGAGEYSGKYAHFASWLSQRQIEACLMDLRGHGRSGGKRCHVDDFNHYALDLDILIKFIGKQYGHKDTFLVSHSIGGLVSVFYSLNFPYQLKGLVVSSPCLGLKLKVEPAKMWFVNVLHPLLKNIRFYSHIKPQMATHDEAVIEKFKGDPYIHHIVTCGFYIQMLRAINYVLSRAADLRAPLLVLQAGDDMITDEAAAERFYKQAGSADKEYKLYKGFYHELLNESNREQVYKHIYEWIKRRCCKDVRR